MDFWKQMWVYDFPQIIKVKLRENSALVSDCMVGSEFLKPLMEIGKSKITLVLHLNVLYKHAHSSEYVGKLTKINL